MDLREKFRDWLVNNAHSASGSVDKYCAALNTVAYHLEQCMGENRNIYSITNIDEVKRIKGLYKTNELMKEKDKGRMYSAGLGWYEKFIMSLNGMEKNDSYLNSISIKKIVGYLNKKGYYYSESIFGNFYLSLKSKPFTILAGISGTGKSKLVRVFAEAIGARFELIPVKPDWSDATDLLGYRDLNQVFHKGRFIEIIDEAMNNLTQPYMICLDEMNLARVEYYFSDFLSLIESRRWNEDEIITDSFGGEDLKAFYIPENVYIVGTVNMDETTFQFSKKLLDRANTIELSEVDLNYSFEEEGEVTVPLSLYNDALKSKYLVLKECAGEKQEVQKIINDLIEINDYLKPCGLQFAYRTRDEIIFYMLYNKEYRLLEEAEAFDFQILQKILPRINGTSPRIRRLILNLCNYCLGQKDSMLDYEYEAEQLETKSEKAIYPKSYQKLLEMLRRYDEDGFTSFWF